MFSRLKLSKFDYFLNGGSGPKKPALCRQSGGARDGMAGFFRPMQIAICNAQMYRKTCND